MRYEFEIEPREIPFESEKQGKLVMKDVEMVKVHIGVDRNSVFYTEVEKQKKTLEDRVRSHGEGERGELNSFVRQYEAWKKGTTFVEDGTALTQWPAIGPAHAKKLIEFGIATVQSLAALSDSECQKMFPGTLRLRGMAQTWLKERNGSVDIVKLASDLESMKQTQEKAALQNAEKDKLIADLQAQLLASQPQDPLPAAPTPTRAAPRTT